MLEIVSFKTRFLGNVSKFIIVGDIQGGKKSLTPYNLQFLRFARFIFQFQKVKYSNEALKRTFQMQFTVMLLVQKLLMSVRSSIITLLNVELFSKMIISSLLLCVLQKLYVLYLHRGGGKRMARMGVIVILASCQLYFIRVHKNLMQHPGNNTSIIISYILISIALNKLISSTAQQHRLRNSQKNGRTLTFLIIL